MESGWVRGDLIGNDRGKKMEKEIAEDLEWGEWGGGTLNQGWIK